MSRLFHGGMPGLKVGDLVVPQESPGWHRDDCSWCRSGADDSRHPETIYVTTEREYARYYASRFGKGWLYVVEPVGDVERSTEDGPETYRCASALVRSIYERCVVVTRNQRRRVFKMMPHDPANPGLTFEQMEALAICMARRP